MRRSRSLVREEKEKLSARSCAKCGCRLPLARKASVCSRCQSDPHNKSNDKPAWQCSNVGCNNKATWQSPIRGTCWRACSLHKMRDDEPLSASTETTK
jgi:hypothetical protein